MSENVFFQILVGTHTHAVAAGALQLEEDENA